MPSLHRLSKKIGRESRQSGRTAGQDHQKEPQSQEREAKEAAKDTKRNKRKRVSSTDVIQGGKNFQNQERTGGSFLQAISQHEEF